MTLRQFYDWQSAGGAHEVEVLVRTLEDRGIAWCMRLEDTLRGKLAVFGDGQRRPSKRQKDLLDIARLIEAHPGLRDHVPAEVLEQLVR